MFEFFKRLFGRKPVKLINDFWVDRNGNKWDADLCSEEDTLKYSASLINCSNCTDCKNCIDCDSCIHCEDCKDCMYCRDCRGCSYCWDCCHCGTCKDCTDCSCCEDCITCRNCNACNSFHDNPERIIGPTIGSRNGQPSVYWLEPGKEQCIVGCFHGTLAELEKRVEERHKDSPVYLKQYREFIEAVRAYQKATKQRLT